MFYRGCKDRTPWNFTGIDGLTALQSLSALSAVRQLGVGVFIKSLSRACFVKELWIRTLTSHLDLLAFERNCEVHIRTEIT